MKRNDREKNDQIRFVKIISKLSPNVNEMYCWLIYTHLWHLFFERNFVLFLFCFFICCQFLFWAFNLSLEVQGFVCLFLLLLLFIVLIQEKRFICFHLHILPYKFISMDNSQNSSQPYSLGAFGNLKPHQIQSPYLNLSLPQTISSNFIIPEGASINRGRFELAFSQIGASIMVGSGLGGAVGTYKGIICKCIFFQIFHSFFCLQE